MHVADKMDGISRGKTFESGCIAGKLRRPPDAGPEHRKFIGDGIVQLFGGKVRAAETVFSVGCRFPAAVGHA